MVNHVLLAAIRRLRSQSWCESTYETVLTAYTSRQEKVVVITSKGSESENASGQIVISAADFDMWMATLEARLQEYADAAAGTGTTHTGVEHVVHSNRYVST